MYINVYKYTCIFRSQSQWSCCMNEIAWNHCTNKKLQIPAFTMSRKIISSSWPSIAISIVCHRTYFSCLFLNVAIFNQNVFYKGRICGKNCSHFRKVMQFKPEFPTFLKARPISTEKTKINTEPLVLRTMSQFLPCCHYFYILSRYWLLSK